MAAESPDLFLLTNFGLVDMIKVIKRGDPDAMYNWLWINNNIDRFYAFLKWYGVYIIARLTPERLRSSGLCPVLLKLILSGLKLKFGALHGTGRLDEHSKLQYPNGAAFNDLFKRIENEVLENCPQIAKNIRAETREYEKISPQFRSNNTSYEEFESYYEDQGRSFVKNLQSIRTAKGTIKLRKKYLVCIHPQNKKIDQGL